MVELFEPFSQSNTVLMQAVAQSDYGRALNGQIRYERYCYISEGVKHLALSPERRQEIRQLWGETWLDCDVNNLQHNTFTAYFGKCIAELDNLDTNTAERAVRALLVHDLKEYVFDPNVHEGDLTYDEMQRRGSANYSLEHQDLASMLRAEQDFFRLDEETITDIENILNDSKLKPPQTEAGLLVEKAERLGYVHSALNAIQICVDSKWDGVDFEQRKRFAWMCENVLANHIPRLLELATNFESVRVFLESRRADIDLAFYILENPVVIRDIGKLYESDGADATERHEMFVEAARQWAEHNHWKDMINTPPASNLI